MLTRSIVVILVISGSLISRVLIDLPKEQVWNFVSIYMAATQASIIVFVEFFVL